MARKLLNAGYKLDVYDPDLKVSQIVGQNLGYSFLHLPSLNRLMVSKEEAEARKYDLVIDTMGLASGMVLNATKLIAVDKLP
jgi:GDP-mannose 6-dehydrogenase